MIKKRSIKFGHEHKIMFKHNLSPRQEIIIQSIKRHKDQHLASLTILRCLCYCYVSHLVHTKGYKLIRL